MTTLEDAMAAVMKARLAMRAAGLDGAELARVARGIAAEMAHEKFHVEQTEKRNALRGRRERDARPHR